MTAFRLPISPCRTLASALVLLCAGTAVLAQAIDPVSPTEPTQVTPPAATPADPGAPPPAFRPGFIDAFGKLIEQGVNNMTSTLGKMNDNAKGAGDAARDAAAAAGTATRDAAGGLVLLPMSRMVTGRERCDVAPNGAPDCAGAVVRICQAQGLAVGRSMDVETSENCPAATLLARRYGQPEPAPCRMESFVTKALCQ